MGETDIHRDLMLDLIEALKYHYKAQQDVYVSGNILFYYEEGNPTAHLSPDVLVTPGMSNEPRETYKLWVEKKAPELIVEVTSKSTKLRDKGLKKGLYEALGVREYLLFDPRGDYLQPRFQVFRLEGEYYLPCVIPEASGYQSRLGLTFLVLDGTLRILETNSGKLLPTPSELAELAQRNEARAEAEAQRANTEAQRADSEAQRADSEAERARRLEEKLRELGIDPDA